MISIILALSATSIQLGYGYKNNKEEDIGNFQNSSLPTRRTSSSGFQVIGIKYKRGLVTLSLGDHCC